ncbi:MAG: 3,4-dihydroxy-2-butanone-4-phosphate synthase [Desulfurococcales archaeon]|nr:3,4-dihydroxy-2-butanone-4-phosphate synthase [Desulfurococcales archaeon]
MQETLKQAIDALRSGRPIMIFDGEEREGEVDLVYYAEKADVDAIYNLRTLAGGLICYATTWEIARNLGLIWGDELISLHEPLKPLTQKKTSYGDRPAFTIWVNHASTKTGIPDKERSKTIRELDKVVKLYLEESPDKAKKKFLEEFQAPGHVPILAARKLDERRGHTELSICLAELAGLRPSVVFAEMLDKGDSLSLKKARELSKKHGIPLVTGEEIIEACRI